MSNLPRKSLVDLQNAIADHSPKKIAKRLRKGSARRQVRKEIGRTVGQTLMIALLPVALWAAMAWGMSFPSNAKNSEAANGMLISSLIISVLWFVISGIVLIVSIFKAGTGIREQGRVLDEGSADCGVVSLKDYAAERVSAGKTALVVGFVALSVAVVLGVVIAFLLGKVDFVVIAILACTALVLAGVAFGLIKIGGCFVRTGGFFVGEFSFPYIIKYDLIGYACPKCEMINTTVKNGQAIMGAVQSREWKSGHVGEKSYTPTADVYDQYGSKIGSVKGSTRYTSAYDIYSVHQYQDVTTPYKCVWCGYTHSKKREQTISYRQEGR